MSTFEQRLAGRRVWIVTDGTAATQGWHDALVDALAADGATVEVLGVPGAIGATARNLFESGMDAVARAFRITGSDGQASDAAARMLDRRPELIVADHPNAVRVLVFLRDTLRVGSLVVGMSGSWQVRETWSESRPDALIVADEAHLAVHARAELPAEARVVAGPPVPVPFATPMDRAACRANVATAEDRRVVVVDATAFRPERIEPWVGHVSALGVDFDLLFYHGGDALLSDRLRFLAAQSGVVARMFGPAPGFAEIFAAADLIGTGSASAVFEAITSLGTPLFSLEAHDRETKPGRVGAVWVFDRPEAAGSWLVETLASGPDPRHIEAARQLASEMGTAPVVHALGDLLARWAQTGPPRAQGAGGPVPSTLEPIGGDVPRTGPPTPGLPTTRDAALQQLSLLIREEKQLQERATAVARERDRWLVRAEIAREENEAELEQAAESRLAGLRDQLAQTGERMEALQRRREEIRRAVASFSRGTDDGAAAASPAPRAAGDPYEARFRELEMKRELDRLRRRTDTAGETE